MKNGADMFVEPILQVEDLVVEYPVGRGRKVHAVSGVSFSIARGETFGLVGESGCGKSSVARTIMQLPSATSGRVVLDGIDLAALEIKRLQRLRQQFQLVFQDPVAALNPRRKIGKSIGMPLQEMAGLSRDEISTRVRQMMESVGLDPDRNYDRLPFQLSGGQCQRAGIARALISAPQLLVCDEPVSSLDVSVQAQIINLLQDLKAEYGLAMLFISHDLAVVKHICDRVAVMYLGKFCEVASAEQLYQAPAHPYTRALLSAIPVPDPGQPPTTLDICTGELPSATEPPSGCRFRTRCPHAEERCTQAVPELRELNPGHRVACHFPLVRDQVDSTEETTGESQIATAVSDWEGVGI